MIAKNDLRTIAQARLEDADALLKAGRFDGAYYLCGYAVEVALKFRICETLNWPSYPPQSGRDFPNIKIHSIETLLMFSGVDRHLRNVAAADLSYVSTWGPEKRYQTIGTVTRSDVSNMIQATKNLLELLL